MFDQKEEGLIVKKIWNNGALTPLFQINSI